MKILPIDIRQKTFSKKALGGFNPTEVKEFLYSISEEWFKCSLHTQELERQVAFLKEELEKVRGLESQLMQQCERTEKAGIETQKQAEKEASLKIIKAETEANAILDAAKQKASLMLHQVKSDCESQMKAMKAEFDLLSDSFKEVDEHSGKMLNEMGEFVETTQERLAKLANLKKNKVAKEKVDATQNLLRATFAHASIQLDKMISKNGFDQTETKQKEVSTQPEDHLVVQPKVEKPKHTIARKPDTSVEGKSSSKLAGNDGHAKSIYEKLHEQKSQGKLSNLELLRKKQKKSNALK